MKLKFTKKRKHIIALTVSLILAFTLLSLVACGGGSGIGSNPKIPDFAKNAPASAAALVTAFEANSEFSDIESESYGGMDMVSAKRTIGGKEYEVVAMNYGSQTEAAQYFSTMRSAYDAALKVGGEASLKNALKEEGITNFNWDDTGMSYTQDGYDCFWKVSGSWWIVQGPLEAI